MTTIEEVSRLGHEYMLANRDYEAAWRECRKIDFEYKNKQIRLDNLSLKVLEAHDVKEQAQNVKEEAHTKYLEAKSRLEEEVSNDA